MTTITIVLLILAVITIIVSFVITPADKAGEDVEERTTPGIPEELTEADKKHLRKLTDGYVNEYSKKKVKELVKGKVEGVINDEVSRSTAKMSNDLTTKVQGNVDGYYNDINASLENSKKEAETQKTSRGKAAPGSFLRLLCGGSVALGDPQGHNGSAAVPGRDAQRSADVLNELEAQLVLHTLDVAAQRRLRKGQRAGRLRIVEREGERAKFLERLQ